jgi:chemotaxis protein histidine kinase CheA
VSLLELVRLEGEQARKGIELVDGAPVYRLRGKLLPLVHLNRELKMGSSAAGHGVGTGVLAKDQEFDFTVARDKHRQWINTLHQVLDNKLIMTADQAGSHEKCALGQWLYGTALEQYRSIREMQTLEATHKTFHELVREVLRLQEHQEHARAEQELARAGQLSGKIMELLTAVEAQVREHQNVNIVVLRADDRQFGLVVDEINDTEEIVVKPLSKQLKSINTYAGATIMGDGKVALILDVMGLAQRANVVGDARDRALTDKDEQAKSIAETAVGERNAVLLFQHGENGQMAIDLSLVARLEEFSRDSIETAGEHEVVQYRGQIMPLVRVSEVLENRQQISSPTAQQTLHVVVYSDQGHSVGLVVDRILDIVEESFVMQRHAGRTGVLGSAVIQKRVTDIVDVPGLIAAAKGNQLFAGAQV